MARRTNISFHLNGDPVLLSSVDPSRTLLDWLREEQRLSGTKEGCREGDCGACTVVIIDATEGGPAVRAVNSCILFLPMIDGKAVFTVEGVAPAGALHPAQQALVEQHGSQCGFCTPGFVMSLFAASLKGEKPDDDRLDEILAGNLCRCTGYAPIIAAARQGLSQDCPVPADYLTEEASGACAPEGMLDIRFDCPSRGRLAYCAPTSLEQLLEELACSPEALILAGGTDVGLWVTKQARVLPCVIDITRVKELREVTEGPAYLTIGAGLTYNEARSVLASHFPALAPLISRIASEQIRNSGTIGGNIANGSPIGDMPPALIALNAQISLARQAGQRKIALEDFFIAYGRQDRASDEVLTSIEIPWLAKGAFFRTWKVTKRFDQDISSVCGAFHLRLVEGCADEVRICFGGMAGTPARARHAEAALAGTSLDASAIKKAVAALADDFAPLTDRRASARYRTLAAQGLLRRFLDVVEGKPAAELERRAVW